MSHLFGNSTPSLILFRHCPLSQSTYRFSLSQNGQIQYCHFLRSTTPGQPWPSSQAWAERGSKVGVERQWWLLHTGFGKSIIYEVLLFIFDYKLERVDGLTRSLVLVVSPLISLMADQVASLQRRGARAAMISFKCATIRLGHCLCMCSFLFGSPEALLTSKWREAMDCRDVAQQIITIVIDEAHCVSKWYVL